MVNCDLNSEGLVRTEHKWPEAYDFTVALWETLKFIGFILLPRENPLSFGVVKWKRGKSL